jgi:hypothetical protein
VHSLIDHGDGLRVEAHVAMVSVSDRPRQGRRSTPRSQVVAHLPES